MKLPCSDRGIFRFLAMAILIALAVTLAAALPGVSADGGEDKAAPIPKSEGTSGDNQAPPIPDKTTLNYPNLGSHLDELVTRVEAGQATSKDAAGDTPVHSGASVAVTIYLSGNVDDVVTFLEENGGDPRNVGEDYIEAYVPVTLLGQLSQQSGVIRVREIVPPQPAQLTQRIAGHGPPVHGSQAWNQAGYSGQGVKVGIIDTGFQGFSGLMGTELPAAVVARCYTDIGRFTTNLADCENEDVHGTAVAESVIDIASEVSLYIANPESLGDLSNTADWMISEGVSVINTSLSYAFDGPGDGTSPYSNSPLKAVDRAVASGVAWVTAAGNAAEQTWFGPYANSDGDRWVDFHSSGWERNYLTLPAHDEIELFEVELRWEDSWDGASSNLDLFLVTGEEVESARDLQSGASGHDPHEYLRHVLYPSIIGHFDYFVAVEHVGGEAPEWIQLRVRFFGRLQHRTGNFSITNPAESANLGMLAVGAAHWNDVRAIEPYSSRGPTPDGRVKPDIVGADCGATALSPLDEYNTGFCGTSQASPHVAGLAALVRQRFPDNTPAQVAGYLKDFAQQRETPDPNYTWGHGFAQLPSPTGNARPTPPTLSNAFSRNPAADFNGLESAGNPWPRGIWSDETTMWVADVLDKKIYAYDMSTKARVPGKDFDTLKADGRIWTRGIWSDETTMWVADFIGKKIYAYDMSTKARVPSKDFDTLKSAGNQSPTGIWSDETTMWVAGLFEEKIYAYDLATRARVPGKDFDTLKAAGNTRPYGIWSDGTTVWVADLVREKIFAYDLATKARVPDKDFNTLITAANFAPVGIWSDGTTMWVGDTLHDKIYAYWMLQVESAADRDALVALYNATGGANWTNNTNWLTNAPIGQWHGVTTDGNGRVTNLDLNDNQLSGTIPTQLNSLANLKELWLSENQLTGEIPPELGSLTNLMVLDLDDNDLTGTMPTQLGDLINLEGLHLTQNQLAGEIPPELGNLVKLERLSLSDNQLTGMLPDSLTRMTALTRFFFYNNPGLCAPVGDAFQEWLESIADGIGSSCAPVDSPEDRSVLVKLHGATGGAGWGNSATWLSDRPVREWYGVVNDASGRVTGLFLHRNQLTGEIPAELGNLTNLAHLRLDGNRLTGTIPAELGRLTNLTVLYLSGNPLTGCVPASLRDVADNDFAELGLTFCTSREDLSIAGDAAVSDYAENQEDTTVATYTVSGDNVATAMWSLLTGDPDGDGPLMADQTRDQEYFELEGTGQERMLKFKDAPNFEMPRGQALSDTNTNVYMVTLQVRHDDEDIAFRPVTITVTDVDELGMLSGDDSFSYAEGGTDAVGTYTLTAIEDGPTVTWSLDGTDMSDFMLEGTGMSRMLKFSSAPDYEAPADADSDNTYMVTVKASAGGEMKMVDVTVTVTNVVELGMLTADMDSPISYMENGTMTVATYTVSGTMADMATWTLEGDDAESFMLEGTGMSTMLKFSSAPDYEAPADADSDNTYMVTVKAEAGSEMAMQAVAVMVTNVVELGMLTGMENPSHPENSMDTVATYTVSGGDGTTVNWSLGGADGSHFMLDGTDMSRMLKFKSAPDYEMPRGTAMSDDNTNTYMVTVKAEAGGVMEMVEVTVMVTNEEEDGTVTLSTMSPAVGSEVTASLTDLDGSITGTTWQWASADAMDGDFTNIDGATSASYTPVEDDAGMYLQATASYTDGHGTGKMATSETVMVNAVTIVGRYDTDGTPGISIAELFDAIDDYFENAISIAELFEVIDAYFG